MSDNNECLRINELNIKITALLKEDRYVARSEYLDLIPAYKETIDYFKVLRDSEMLDSFCSKKDVDKEIIIETIEYYDHITEKVDAANYRYIQKALVTEKDYLDHILADVDSNITLDEEQRKVVLNDEDFCLVIAGAGAGKTTTLAAKVKYLVEKKKIQPRDILVISYTNKAVGELRDKINKALGIDCPITTFHATGNAILHMDNPEQVNVVDRSKLYYLLAYYKGIIMHHKLKVDAIISVSALIDWQTADGTEVDPSSIRDLPKNDIESLEIAFDGRYHIEELLHILDEAILDTNAQMGLRMAFRLEELVKRLSKHLTNIFSGIAATIALSPIPVSDIYVLIILQAILVVLIASLSGRDLSIQSAIEFIFSLGGITGAGHFFRLLAQQLAKLLNGIFPGSGSVVSSTIAFSGTESIGNAAVAYYIEGKDIKQVKNLFKKLQKAKDKK